MTKRLTLLLLAALLGLAGCNTLPVADAQAIIKGVADTAATQPGGASVAKAANDVNKAIDSAAPILAKVESVKTDVQTLQTKVADVANGTKSISDRLDALQQAVGAGANVVHTAAPGTSADTIATAAVGVIGLLALVGKVLDNKATRTAITTPGTTPSPEAKG